MVVATDFFRCGPSATGCAVTSSEVRFEGGVQCYPSAATMAENGDRNRNNENGG